MPTENVKEKGVVTEKDVEKAADDQANEVTKPE